MIYLHVYLYIYTTVIITIYVTWNSCNMGRVICLICMPKAEGHRPKGIHIRQIMSAHVTTDMASSAQAKG